jgi:Bacterial mobilisation protein (MobC)
MRVQESTHTQISRTVSDCSGEDWRLLRERAKARGMPSATYLSYLARSHLRGACPLPKAEYTLLKQSVEQLAAVGRNLNQIARAMNQGDRPVPASRARRSGECDRAGGTRGDEAPEDRRDLSYRASP